MIEYMPQLLGFLVVVAAVRTFWSPFSKLLRSTDKYELDKKRIERRKKELGIEDDVVEVEKNKGTSVVKVVLEIVFGIFLGVFIIIMAFYFYSNA